MNRTWLKTSQCEEASMRLNWGGALMFSDGKRVLSCYPLPTLPMWINTNPWHGTRLDVRGRTWRGKSSDMFHAELIVLERISCMRKRAERSVLNTMPRPSIGPTTNELLCGQERVRAYECYYRKVIILDHIQTETQEEGLVAETISIPVVTGLCRSWSWARGAHR